MLVIRSVLARGRQAGVVTTLGICSGLFVHARLSAPGVSAVLMRSATAFEVLKLAGAAYLILLGARSIRRAARPGAAAPEAVWEQSPLRVRAGRWSSFREGLLTNVLNPKVSVFYLAFLPQFIRPTDPVLARSVLLAAIHFLIGVVWLLLVVHLLGRLGRLLSRPVVQRRLEAVTVALGVRIALERR